MVKNSLGQSESSYFSESYSEAEFFLLKAGTNSIFKLLQKNLFTRNKKNQLGLAFVRRCEEKEKTHKGTKGPGDENMKGCCTSSKSNQALIFISRHPQF